MDSKCNISSNFIGFFKKKSTNLGHKIIHTHLITTHQWGAAQGPQNPVYCKKKSRNNQKLCYSDLKYTIQL